MDVVIRITGISIVIILRVTIKSFIIFALGFFIINIRLDYYAILRNYISNTLTT